MGRWTQKDPVGGSVGKVGSGNAYVYADNAPVMTDPSGRASLLAVSVAVQGLIAALCGAGAFLASPTIIILIIGIPLETALGACAVAFGLSAAIGGIALLSQI